MNVVGALLLVLVPAVLPALALTRSAARAVLLCAPVCVVVGGVSGIVCVLLRVPVAPCAAVLFVAANVAALIVLRRSARDGSAALVIAADGDPVALVTAGLASVMLLVGPPEPIAWDARSIWWFKAAWFRAGGDAVLDAIDNPLMAFSHPEYPIGVPSFIGAAWGLIGDENLRLAMAITAVLTALAVAMLVGSLFASARIDGASLAVPVVLTAAIVMQGEGLAAAGYVDVLAAALVAFAFAEFVRHRSASLAALTALAAATLTKGEGLFFGALICLVALPWVDRRVRFVLVAATAAIPAVVWTLIVRVTNPDLAADVAPGGFARLLLLDGERWSRVPEATAGVWGELWPFLTVAALATAGLLLRPGETPGHVRRLVLAGLLASVVTSAGLVAVYAAGVPDVEWWLDTSLERSSVMAKVLCLVTTAVAVDGLGRFGGATPAGEEPEHVYARVHTPV